MLRRKISDTIREYLQSDYDRIMIVEGARQVGKSFIIREIGKELFKNFIEINLAEDKNGRQEYETVRTSDDLYLRLSIYHGDKMGNKNDTLIFLDEIQEYPHLITMLKFLNEEQKFRFIASGSLLGVTLNNVVSIPVGSIRIVDMYPLNFIEFLWANGFNDYAIEVIKERLSQLQSLDKNIHLRIMDLWKKYLIVGGLPAVVNSFISNRNYTHVRDIQRDIVRLYAADASKYDKEHRLKIQRIYNLIPSNMENKKKRMVARDIAEKENARFADYVDEFEYLISSGIALDVKAVTNPKFPLAESVTKNLLKLYMNDPGLLTCVLFEDAVRAILDDARSINLGSIYETAVAAQLKANGANLFYYDNKKKGEVDFLINDFANQTVLPIEVKSGKDYKIHSAISRLLNEKEYNIERGMVLANIEAPYRKDKIQYFPVYYSMFL